MRTQAITTLFVFPDLKMIFSRKLAILCFILLCVSTVFSAPTESSHENVKKLAVANNNLALNLYECLSTNSSENIFFSPFSLSTAFGMLFNGAKGNTAEELSTVLGYKKAELPSEYVHSSFNQFLTHYVPEKDSNNSDYTLDIANSILIDRNMDLIPTYKSDMQNFYQASISNVDYLRDGPTIVNEINQWVKTKTHGKIDSFLDELSPKSIMVLLNAVYFKGDWKTKFDPKRTIPETFYNNGVESEAKKIPMMHNKAKYFYAKIDDFQVLELPYKGGNISMFIFLPNQMDGIYSLEKRLTINDISSIHQRLYLNEITVSLPKFKIEYSKELSSAFQTLGARKVFSAETADFSGITKSEGLYVSSVNHKAVLEVNEEGSEAAAVTGIMVIPVRPSRYRPIYFTADHPFLFTIVDNRSDMILFVGRVNKL